MGYDLYRTRQGHWCLHLIGLFHIYFLLISLSLSYPEFGLLMIFELNRRCYVTGQTEPPPQPTTTPHASPPQL